MFSLWPAYLFYPPQSVSRKRFHACSFDYFVLLEVFVFVNSVCLWSSLIMCVWLVLVNVLSLNCKYVMCDDFWQPCLNACVYYWYVIADAIKISSVDRFSLSVIVISRDHSFPRHMEFWAEPGNLPVSTEFLHFRGICYWLVISYWHYQFGRHV